MSVITNIKDLEENIELFENYLCEGSEEQQKACQDLIKKGHCFIAYEIENELRFTPSRYIGYKSNTIEDHQLRSKNGTETNTAINKILGSHPIPDEILEKKYQSLCCDLGIIPENRTRKFWMLNISGKDFTRNTFDDREFPEGKLIERTHKARERNRKLITEAKENFKNRHGTLFCEACGFDFENKYGERGKDYIEGHHDVPVSEMGLGRKTSINEISMVCANCHRIIHRTRPWLSVAELKKHLTSET